MRRQGERRESIRWPRCGTSKTSNIHPFYTAREAIHHGAVKRLRPKFMTVATTMIGLVPIMWSAGTAADVMKRIAAPMIGGIVTSFALELLVYPVI
jgi:Cu(I)/Ag(I) efflux system membrane protein CusA/SilA